MSQAPEMYSPHNSGSFLSFDVPPPNPVVTIDHNKKDDVRKKHGTIARYMLTLQDGTRYPVFSGTPRDQVTSLPVISSPAYLTNAKGGMNMHVIERYLEEGIPIDMVDVEQVPFRRSLVPTSLAQSARNLLEIFPAMAGEYNRGLDLNDETELLRDPNNITFHVTSQASMKATGVMAMASDPREGVHVVGAQIIGPCGVEEISLKPSRDGLIEGMVRERGSIRRVTGDSSGTYLSRLPRTLDLSARNLGRNIVNQDALRKGAVASFIRNFSPDQSAHFVIGGGKWLDQSAAMQRSIADHPTITHEVLDGGHFEIVREDIQEAAIQRNLDRITAFTIEQVNPPDDFPPEAWAA